MSGGVVWAGWGVNASADEEIEKRTAEEKDALLHALQQVRQPPTPDVAGATPYICPLHLVRTPTPAPYTHPLHLPPQQVLAIPYTCPRYLVCLRGRQQRAPTRHDKPCTRWTV